MIRRLLGLLALLGLAALVRAALRAARPPAPRRAPGGPAASPRFEGALVRDRVCGTFLPRSRALSLRDGAGEAFFCSERCREAHRSGVRPARTA